MLPNSDVENKLKAYKRKYYLSMLLNGVLTTLLVFLFLFLIGSLLEYTLWMNSWMRGVLLFSIIGFLLFLIYKHIFLPVLFIINSKKGISDDLAASYLGKYFPLIADQLLNFIQLKRIEGNNVLAQASLNQREKNFESVNFSTAITYRNSLQVAKFLLLPITLIVLLSFWNPNLFLSSSKRIIRFQESFVAEAPFKFKIINNELIGFENEDYLLEVQLTGNSFPSDLYVIEKGRKIKMQNIDNQTFSYIFQKIRASTSVRFEGAGYSSIDYKIMVVPRPSLRNFNLLLNYPNYLNRKNESITNTGNITIPEGTEVSWQLKTYETKQVTFVFKNEEHVINPDDQIINFRKSFTKSSAYDIRLQNEYASNNEQLTYSVTVIPDEHPTISLNSFQDTTLYSFIILGGNISDDYGLTSLKLFYTFEDETKYKNINIPIDYNQTEQSYYHQWQFDSILLQEGKALKYYLQVWDNDGIHGRKSTKTGVYSFKLPNKSQAKAKIAEASKQIKNDINKSLKEALELKDQLDKTEEKLKGKKELSWQDKNMIKDILNKKEELNKAIEQLKEKNKFNSLQQQRFSEQNERINEKVEQLQQLMDDLLDEETKKLYDELQKLLEEQQDISQIQDLIEQINNREDNLEKELERTLELFKKMKFDYELNEKINELNELADDQEKLQEETKDSNIKTDELLNKQEIIENTFEEIKKELEELNELGNELKNPKDLPKQEALSDEIKKAIEQSKENLGKEKSKQAQKAQEEISQKMKEMANELQQSMASMQMMKQQENLDHLRDIIHNLLKLSFDQEQLMNEFREVDQSDPRFVELSQEQIKLMENSEIVKDSLESLANRVFQIQSFVTREINDMNNYMEASSHAIKERQKAEVTTKQQFAMTSMNNLALLLDDVLQQMQNAMADAMSQGQPSDDDMKMPSMSEMQKQLNKKIEELKKGGAKGRKLSEELAKLAAEQERIRKALQEAQEKFDENKNGQIPGNGIPEKMEETEIDLVNKNITDETIKRQQEILTRLLEAEEALREKELDEEREAETAREQDNVIPRAFEEYFKLKEKEIELLKTVPPKLYPYYKKEVNDYFKRIGNTP